MGRLVLRSLACLVVTILCAGAAVAAVPSTINAQGKLTDSGGLPLPAGTKTFTFRVFDAASGGTKVWPAGAGEVQSVTTSTEGLWTALVGAIEPLNQGVFADTLRWLEIEVDGTILPRVRLASGPFAFRVASVDGAAGGQIISKVTIGPGNTNSGNEGFVAGSDNSATANYTTISGGALNSASGESSTISGGQQNIASGFASSIGGGASNDATSTYSAVGGGYNNSSTNSWTVVGGGFNNLANNTGATVGGGGYNNARGQYSTVAGGGGPAQTDSNSAGGDAAQVGGGAANVASGYGSGVDGGRFNVASGVFSAIGGGQFNSAEGSYAVIAGGGGPSIFNDRNIAQGLASVIGGGSANRAVDNFSTVGGGRNHQTRGMMSTIAGGTGNLTDGQAATVGGGDRNAAAGTGATVSGGTLNYTSWYGSVVAGGDTNAVNAAYGVIGGGILNDITGPESVIDGGRENTASASLSTVGGGVLNSATGIESAVNGGRANTTSGYQSSVGGGAFNHASGSGSHISGGSTNTAIGIRAFIGGGERNIARGSYSVVGGGGGSSAIDSNSAQGYVSVVVGGSRNVAGGNGSFIGGGDSNRSKGMNSTMGGGGFNSADGSHSTVPGGHVNAARGDFSFAAGSYSRANHFGAFVWSDRSPIDPAVDTFYSTAANQFLIRAAGGVGIGTTAPQQALSVAAGMNLDQANANGGTVTNSLRFGSSSGEAIASKRTAGGNQFGLDFYANSINRMSITNSGRVGIGTTTPLQSLDVSGAMTVGGAVSGSARHVTLGSDPNAFVELKEVDGTGTPYIDFCNDAASDFDARIMLTSDDELAIDGATVNLGNGNLNVWSGNVCALNVVCPSDVRLKEGIHPLSDAVEQIERLHGVSYRWSDAARKNRNLPNGEQVGLIAQEVRKVIPQAVIEQSDGYLAVDYARLVPLLIEGMKEQQRQIEEQLRMIEALRLNVGRATP